MGKRSLFRIRNVNKDELEPIQKVMVAALVSSIGGSLVLSLTLLSDFIDSHYLIKAFMFTG